MFYGSDTHAESAAAIFSLIASCRLHRLEPEQYLGEVMCYDFLMVYPINLARAECGQGVTFH